MKFWRTTAVVALVALAAASAFAAMAPKAPAAAAASVSCMKNTLTAPVFPIVMCNEMQDATSTYVGNGFPWENSTFFFSTYRNQFLYPSSMVDGVAAASITLESVQTRSTSFTGANTNDFGSFTNGAASFVRVTDAVSSSLVTTFAANPKPGAAICEITGTSAAPIQMSTMTGPNGSLLQTCTSCANGDRWCNLGNITPGVRTYSHVLLDQNLRVVGGSGYGVWDTTTSLCSSAQRAYGSGSFANPNHLTTALSVDTYNWPWVGWGVGKPPAATVEQQIKEIVRLLLTPEGLRCSGLDLTPGNGIIEDDPFSFPMGKAIDPIQPQVTTGGTITGDELVDGMRSYGWKP